MVQRNRWSRCLGARLAPKILKSMPRGNTMRLGIHFPRLMSNIRAATLLRRGRSCATLPAVGVSLSSGAILLRRVLPGGAYVSRTSASIQLMPRGQTLCGVLGKLWRCFMIRAAYLLIKHFGASRAPNPRPAFRWTSIWVY